MKRYNLKELKQKALMLGADQKELKKYNSRMGVIVLINRLEREIKK